MRVIERAFPAEAGQVSEARHLTAGLLRECGIPPDDTLIVVSELAANAITHARSDFTLRVTADSRAVRVEVADHSPTPPVSQQPSTSDFAGRGIFLVEALALDWGVQQHPDDGKTVWAEMRVGSAS